MLLLMNLWLIYFDFDRLLDVVHNDKKLFLVFEFLDRDLKKYMDTLPASGISLALVKVNLTAPSTCWKMFSCSLNYYKFVL